jgi:4-amino-4-deoxy-L-arabinose transferase-like glycosyltransferase
MQDLTAPAVRARRVAILIAIAGGLLALAMRWYYVMHAQVLQPIDEANVRADAVDYYRYAWNLVHHATFAVEPAGSPTVTPNTFRDPGYPVLLAGWMLLTPDFDHWYGGILLTQALLGALSVTLTLLTVRSRVPNIALGVAGLLMAFWPHSISITSYVLTETQTGFLCAAGLLCLREALERRRASLIVLTGLVFGMAALTNAVLAPFGLLAAAALLCTKFLTGRQAATLALASLLLPALWNIRGLTVTSTASSTHRAAMNLVQGSCPSYHEDYQRSENGNAAAAKNIATMNAEIDTFKASNWDGLARVGKRMANEPLHYLGWYASKPMLLWAWDIKIGQGDIYVYPTINSPFNTSPTWKAILMACYMLNPFVLLGAAIGVLVALVRRSAGIDVALAVLVLMVTLVYGVLQSEPRYAIPFRNAEIALACLGVAQGWTLYRERARLRDRTHTLRPA